MKAEIDLQKHFLFVSDEIHSWILPGQLNIDLYSSSLYVNHLSVSLGIPVENSVHYKCHNGHLELTWQYPQSELNSVQIKAVCVHQVHYRASMAAPYDCYLAHVTNHKLPTCFQLA